MVRERRGFCLLVAGATALVPACKSAPESAAPAPSGPAPSASVPRVIRPEDLPESQRVPTSWPIPDGPRLAILAGQGVGAIRLGATVATIERLMEAPCEFKTDDACRYVARATEFFLKDGVTAEIHTHRQNRPTTPNGRVFGVFNGRTPEGVAFTMLEPAARELLGPPLKTEKVADGSDFHTVEIDTYDGLRVEYDRLDNGKVVVGGMVIVKPDKPPGAKPGAKAPGPAAPAKKK